MKRYVVDHRDNMASSFDRPAIHAWSAIEAAKQWAEHLYNHRLADDGSLRDEFVRVVETREFETMEARVAIEDGSVVDIDLSMVPSLDWSAGDDESVIVWRARFLEEKGTDVRCVFEQFAGNAEDGPGFYVNHIPCAGDGCDECAKMTISS
jgi:hypothetical protein